MKLSLSILLAAALLLGAVLAQAEEKGSLFQCGPYQVYLETFGSSFVRDAHGSVVYQWDWDQESHSPVYSRRGILFLGKSPAWNLNREYACACVRGNCSSR